jgi:hypothetical protein
MKYYKSLIYVLASLSIIACKKESENVTTDNEVKPNIEIDSFNYKLKNNPKYFLKFWGNMTQKEYSRVKGILISEGKINYSDQYIAGDELIKFEPIIDSKNNSVIGIELFEFSENFYNLLKEKYNLDPLGTKKMIAKCYIERNPCYIKVDCDEKYKRGEFIKVTNEDEIYELMGENFDKKKRLIHPMINNTVLYVPRGERKIITKTANIIVGGIISNTGSTQDKFDLKLSDYEPGEQFFFYSGDKKSVNSEKRIVIKRISPTTLYVDYYPADYFEREKRKNEKGNIEFEKQEKVKKDRLNAVKNEI